MALLLRFTHPHGFIAEIIIGMIAVNQNHSALAYASKLLRADPEIIKIAA